MEDLEARLSLRSLGTKRKQIPLETLVECMLKSSGGLAMVRNEATLEMFWYQRQPCTVSSSFTPSLHILQATPVTKINHSVHFKISLYFSFMYVAFMTILSPLSLKDKIISSVSHSSSIKGCEGNGTQHPSLTCLTTFFSLAEYIPIYNLLSFCNYNKLISIQLLFFLCIFTRLFWG